MPVSVGLIAEDESDVASIKILINLISNKKVGCKSFVGRGCGKITRKCNAWAKQLQLKGCSILILVHDADTNNDKKLQELYDLVKGALAPSPINKYMISIPIQELEAWLLSDTYAIKKALNLPKEPSIKKGIIENISSPKEYLGEIIARTSNGKKTFINTIHNAKIAQHLDIEKVRQKCPSFEPFYDFVKVNI
jgi:hypothetical protein